MMSGHLLIGLAALFVLAAIGVPIALAMALAGFLGFGLIVSWPAALAMVGQTAFDTAFSYSLAILPLFILMGNFITRARLSEDLYAAAYAFVGHLRGGLALSTLMACAGFSSVCGSSLATAATMSRVTMPSMRRFGYKDSLATGAIAAGGTLGILIPPSLTFIVYGIATHTSIARLFLAGVVPGIFLVTIFAVYAWLGSRHHQNALARRGLAALAVPQYTLREKCAGMLRVLPFLAIIAGVTVMMYSGMATPSEVAALAAFLALLLVVVIYRIRSLAGIWRILGDTVRESTMILTIVAAAAMYAYMMSDLYITQSVAEWMLDWGLARWQLLLLINVFLLMAGLFLPPVSIILMSMPVILPVLKQMDIDLVWFAVMMTINLEIGLITPPMGMNLFVIQGVAPQVALRDVILGALPFVALMLGFISLIALVPEIVTWLPDYLMGKE